LFRFRKKKKINIEENRKRKEKKKQKNLTWAGPSGGALRAGWRSLPQRAGVRISEKEQPTVAQKKGTANEVLFRHALSCWLVALEQE
jgi:hypothetical protein